MSLDYSIEPMLTSGTLLRKAHHKGNSWENFWLSCRTIRSFPWHF